jgi:geranylgeranyl diphosphate synthase type 3
MSSSPPNHLLHSPPSHLLEPYYYINSNPGKDVRGALIDCFQTWFQIQDFNAIRVIKDIIADLHNASLLIDDIEDNSKLRRGQPVAHLIYGVAPVINCANYVYFLALQKCHSLHNNQATQIFIQELLNLHRGQGLDIWWRDHNICPTEEEYKSMVVDKTGGLFRLAVGLLQSFATCHPNTDFGPLVNHLGLFFQIRDDLINLADVEYFKSKSFCEDLTEGKFSFPVIHCIRTNTEGRGSRLQSILKQKTEDLDVKRYAQKLMRDSKSLQYTWEQCNNLYEEIVIIVKELGGNEPLMHLLQRLKVQVEKLDHVLEIPEDHQSHVERTQSQDLDGSDSSIIDFT